MKKKLLAILIIILSATTNAVSRDNPNLVDTLKQSFKLIEQYRDNYIQRVDSMKSLRLKTPHSHERVLLSEKIGRHLINVDVDSALLYIYLARLEALELGEENEALRLRMVRQSYLPLRGSNKEAFDNFSRIDRNSLSPELKKEYWKNFARLNYLIAKHYPDNKHGAGYLRNTIMALDSLVLYYPEHSETATFITAQLHLLRGEKNLAVANLIEIQPFLNANKEYEMQSLGIIADFYANRPQYQPLYENNIIKLAIRKINRGTPEPAILAETGRLLYDKGERTIGRELILWSMTHKEDSYGPYRSFPHWEYTSYLSDKAETVRTWIAIAFIILIIILVSMVILFSIFEKKVQKKASTLNAECKELKKEILNLKKLSESAISLSFLSQDLIKEYNLYITRKLKAGQIKDLYAEVETGNYLTSLNNKFYNSFDELFLSNCPNFIEELNKLFNPDKQIAAPADHSLTPELRIAAFMRMGINDSSKLSQALGLSLNTIYTYRNRLKGRAIDRTNFEENLSLIAFQS